MSIEGIECINCYLNRTFLKKKLFDILQEPVYNDALVVFRIAFGFVMFLEAVVWIFSGHLATYVVNPVFTFNFFGFDFLQAIRGSYMYLHFSILAVLSLFLMAGKYTRVVNILVVIFFACFYFMQKTFYNNHYYLTLLLGLLLCFTPSNGKWSLDARPRGYQVTKCPRWCILIFAVQIVIVYFFAATNKLYPDWLSGKVIECFLIPFHDLPVVGTLFQKHWFHLFSSYFSIFYDGFIVYLLLWRRTRLLGIVLSIMFHLFNSFIFQVGSFPYMALVLFLFIIPPKQVHQWMRRFNVRSVFRENSSNYPLKSVFVLFFCLFFVIQLALPLRQYFIKGNVFYTHEGGRIAWRMMLASVSGKTEIKIRQEPGGPMFWYEEIEQDLSKQQMASLGTKPDFIYQYVQFLKDKYSKRGYPQIEVYAINKYWLNGREDYFRLVDPQTDMAKVSWNWFSHNEWILYPRD